MSSSPGSSPKYEQLDEKYKDTLEYVLSHYFRNPKNVEHLGKKIVFAHGVAPAVNSEIADIFYATDFDEAYFVDPGYEERPDSLEKDLATLRNVSETPLIFFPSSCQLDDTGKLEVRFRFEGRNRMILFCAADATKEDNFPKGFNIYIHGKRSAARMDDALLVQKLDEGGFYLPDRSNVVVDTENERNMLPNSSFGYDLSGNLSKFGLVEIPDTHIPIQIEGLDFNLKQILIGRKRRVEETIGNLIPEEEIPVRTFYRDYVSGKTYGSIDEIIDAFKDEVEEGLDIKKLLSNFSDINTIVPVPMKTGGSIIIHSTQQRVIGDEEIRRKQEEILDRIHVEAHKESTRIIFARSVSLYQKPGSS